MLFTVLWTNLAAQTGAYRFIRDGKWGVIDSTGRVIVQPEWDKIYNFRDGITVGVKGSYENGERYYINAEGKILNTIPLDKAYYFINGVGTALKDGQWVYVNSQGEILNPEGGMSRVYDFSSGLGVFIAGTSDGAKKYGVLNEKGEIILPASERIIERFSSNGYSIIKENGLYGVIDSQGRMIVTPSLKQKRFSPGFTTFLDDDGWIFELGTGISRPLLQTGYKAVYLTEDLLSVSQDGKKWGIMDVQGNELTEKSYDRIYRPWGGPSGILIAGIKLTGGYRYYLISSTGKNLSERAYSGYGYFSDSFCFYRDESGKWGLMTLDGNFLTDPVFERVSTFSEGLCAVQQDGKWGYIDESGSYVIPPFYDKAYDFTNHAAVVRTGEREGGRRTYIGRDGNPLFLKDFDWAYSFDSNGVAAVGSGDFETGLFGYINRKGEYILNPEN